MAAGPGRMDRCNPIGLTATGTSLSAVWRAGAGGRVRVAGFGVVIDTFAGVNLRVDARRQHCTHPAGAGKCHAGHGDSGSRRPLRHPAARVDAPVDGQRAGAVLARDQACVGESGCDAAVQEPHGLDLAVAQIRKRGAQRVVVIGASAGGPRAIAVAADPPEGVVAVVALSPARAWDQAPAVVPLLIVADPADSSVDEDRVRAAVDEAPTLVTYVSGPRRGPRAAAAL